MAKSAYYIRSFMVSTSLLVASVYISMHLCCSYKAFKQDVLQSCKDCSLDATLSLMMTAVLYQSMLSE